MTLDKEHRKLFDKRELKAWDCVKKARELLAGFAEENRSSHEYVKQVIAMLSSVERTFEDEVFCYDAENHKKKILKDAKQN